MQNKLTSREQEIFDMMLKGLTPKEIAFNLNIKYSTVDFHRNRIYRKLGVQSIQELIVKYGKAEPKTELANLTEQAVSVYNAAADTPSITKKRNIFIPSLMLALAISVSINFYLFLNANKTSALENNENLTAVFATEDKPLVMSMTCNELWGWNYSYYPFDFFEPKITKGDVYTIKYSFSSDVEMDFLLIKLMDIHPQRPNPDITQLSEIAFISNGKVAADTIYTGKVTLTAEHSASCADSFANYIEFGTDLNPKSQPTITFTKFELSKLKSVSK